ncbi:MAG: hypothetical protein V4584_03790 [Verrucomicrobiota bacterium]
MKIHSRPLLAGLLLACIVSNASGGEVLLHSGPEISTEVSSYGSRESAGPELRFLKQFFIASEVLDKLPSPDIANESAPVSAVRAIDLASRSVDLGERRSFNVTRLELLRTNTPALGKPVDYYLVEMRVNGSTEHRVVLMDGTVLKSRLKTAVK